MEREELSNILYGLLESPAENECLEFKEAKNNFNEKKDLGQYFSALSNEANLKGLRCAWLIFGISDKKDIIGTNYRKDPGSLDELKRFIAVGADRITFLSINELEIDDKRVIMFQIPAATTGIPTPWKGHYYGRDNESLVPLSISKIEMIRNQVKGARGIVYNLVEIGREPKGKYFNRFYYSMFFSGGFALLLGLINIVKPIGLILWITMICLIVIAMASYYLKIRLVSNKKLWFLEEGIHKHIENNEVVTYELIGNCPKCSGKVKVKNRYNKVYEYYETIGICEKSNWNTRHLYTYDNITNIGEEISKEKSLEYKIKTK